MRRITKAAFGIGSFVPLVVIAAQASLLFSGALDELSDAVRSVVVGAVSAGSLIYFVVVIAAIVHIAKRDDLSGKSRAWWIVGVVLLPLFVLPAVWWFLIRPLPPALKSAR